MQGTKTIVHITYKISAGGLEQVLLQTVLGLPQYTHVVISITDSDAFKQRFPETTQFIDLGKQAGSSLVVLWQAFKLLRQIKPTIVHTYNLAGAEFLPIAYLAGVKQRVHCEHGTPQTQAALRSNKTTWLRKCFLPFAKHIIVVSSQLQSWLTEVIGVSASKINIVLNGVNTQVYKNIPKQVSSSFTIGTVARLSVEKNQQLLIKAFAEFLQGLSYQQTTHCSLRIVGDGAQRNDLVALAEQLNISAKVIFVGNSDKVCEELAHLDLFLLTSVSEGMPMTILEAMATGLPVLSTDVGNIAGVLRVSEGGQVVPSNDQTALVAALSYFYLHADERVKMGQNGARYVREHYSDTTMLKAYDRIYNVH